MLENLGQVFGMDGCFPAVAEELLWPERPVIHAIGD